MPCRPRCLMLTVALLACAICACRPTIEKKVEEPRPALELVESPMPLFADDLDRASLMQAVERTFGYLERLPDETPFDYGDRRFTAREVRESHALFLSFLREKTSPDDLAAAVKRHFLVLKANGKASTGKVLFTGYFEPLYPANTQPGSGFAHPIYRRPSDLLRIDLEAFHPKFKGQSIVARIEGKRVVPYYSRAEIESRDPLAGKGLEIAWLQDPVDVAFLQIQGSGRLRLPDGRELPVGYAEANGRPYRAIGGYMIEKGYLTREEMSMQRIRSYLREHPEKVREVLDANPSYVFFRPLPDGPYGNIGVHLTPGRSLAADAALFPKGALAFISCSKPKAGSETADLEWEPFSRFMVIQDTGGAIKGPGRADIFWGNGPYAELAAGHLRHQGELYVIIKKP